MKDDDDDVRMHAAISGGVWGAFVSHKIVILYCCNNETFAITWPEKRLKERSSVLVAWRSGKGFSRLNKHGQKSNNSNQLFT